MEQKLVIDGCLPTFNEITNANRSNRFQGSEQKKQYTDLVTYYCKMQRLKAFKKQVDVTITWYMKNKMKDKDNIMAGQKFIFDGLVNARVLKNDGWKEIGDISHKFRVDKDNERVEIRLKEISK